ncbi:chromosome segregation ATPase [groundwater metagenome]
MIMKYLFGDTMDFPPQRDFLRLLDNFTDTSVKAISIENTVFELKETIIDRRRLKNSVMDEMETFLLTVENAISEAVRRSKEQEIIIQYADKSREYLKKSIEDGKNKISDEIYQEIAQLEKKVDEADEDNRKTLESFFIQDPVQIINKKYALKAAVEGYSAKVQVFCEGDIICVFEIASSDIPFWDGHVKAFDLVRGVEIPARMKKPFLKKEEVPEIVSIDDYFLSDLVLSGKELEVVFKKRLETGAERFRLKMNFSDEFEVEVLHAEENGVEKNIQAVPELKSSLNIFRLNELGEKILEQTNNLYPKKQRLEYIHLNGKDAIKENIVFELMQKVAELFAPIIADIKEHSPFGEELSLKVEDEKRERSEIYLKKSDVLDKLDAIKVKGKKLYEILGVG